jgi:hypothetical protein
MGGIRRIASEWSIRIRAWAAAVVVAFAPGCILIPTPPMGIHEIPAERLATLQPGKTTRIDVLMVFGNPDIRLRDDRVFIYRWDRVRAVGGAIGGAPLAINDHYAFAIEFDGSGRVARSGDFSAFSHDGFATELDKWLRSVQERQ